MEIAPENCLLSTPSPSIKVMPGSWKNTKKKKIKKNDFFIFDYLVNSNGSVYFLLSSVISCGINLFIR